MEYPIHFFATFPRNFIRTVTDWGEVPWLSKDFFSCYKIIRHERSMLFIAWLVFFFPSFSFRSWDEGAKCSLPKVHRQKRWLFMPQVMVWDIHEVKNSLNSFHLVTLWEVYLWTPSHTLAQAIWRPTLKQQACTWTHKSPR